MGWRNRGVDLGTPRRNPNVIGDRGRVYRTVSPGVSVAREHQIVSTGGEVLAEAGEERMAFSTCAVDVTVSPGADPAEELVQRTQQQILGRPISDR